MDASKFKKYINVASQMFIEFEKAYYGDDYNLKKNFSLEKPIGTQKKKKNEKVVQPCFKNQSN